MKILYFTDAHLRSQSDRPKWRVDDHYVSQFEELQEIRDLAVIHNVDLIISGGDTIHHPDVSHALVGDIINWCKTLPCAFYSVVGNHCCFAYRTADLRSSGLGVLFESGMVGRLDELVFEKEKVVIHGIHAFLDPHQGNYLFESKYDGYKKYIVSHNFVIKEDVIFDAVKPKDIKTNADIIFLGHYHKGSDLVEGMTRFINPSSLSRWAINEQHKPTILILDTTTNEIIPIELKSSRPANEIFDLAGAAEMKSTEMNLQTFVDSLNNSTFENVDVSQVVLTKGKEQGILKEILDLCLKKVEEAKEQLK
jgi:DNA repair exonuclease SbcCD nuclease subunit